MYHVLVVEDERHLAIGIKYNLEAEGYRVTLVSDGLSAVKKIGRETQDFDLVILDLMLPEMSGYEVCDTLRSQGKNIPILILSARTLTEDRTRAFDLGANQYLMKPFELDELISRVNNLLSLHSCRAEQRTAVSNSIVHFEFSNVRIDFETFEVTVADQPIRMTQLEMKLLQYFAENEGRVISRQELLENVWDMPGNLQTRAPDQFIRRLRKAFESDPASPRHFLTIRDAGYRFLRLGREA